MIQHSRPDPNPLGFCISGTRKNYYTPNSAGFPREDALVMCYDLQQTQAI